jgi:membrane peptidoglycan carboxypeptidase
VDRKEILFLMLLLKKTIAMTEQTAYLMTDMLKTVVDYGPELTRNLTVLRPEKQEHSITGYTDL